MSYLSHQSNKAIKQNSRQIKMKEIKSDWIDSNVQRRTTLRRDTYYDVFWETLQLQAHNYCWTCIVILIIMINTYRKHKVQRKWSSDFQLSKLCMVRMMLSRGDGSKTIFKPLWFIASATLLMLSSIQGSWSLTWSESSKWRKLNRRHRTGNCPCDTVGFRATENQAAL